MRTEIIFNTALISFPSIEFELRRKQEACGLDLSAHNNREMHRQGTAPGNLISSRAFEL
jgi:hypothetical protein